MAKKSLERVSDRKTRIFISYSRKDIEFAQLLKSELEAKGFQPLLDKTDIAPGEAWQDRLGKLILEADAIVFCVSPHSASSKVCHWEIEESERLGKRIVPVVIDPVDTGVLPEAISRLNFIFFADVSFDEAVSKLNSALNTDLDWLRQHTRIGEQAVEWEARKKSGARLLTGDALRQAEGWLINQPRDANPPTELQKQFILASRGSINRAQRWTLIGAIAVAAVAIVLVFWGMINRFAKEDALLATENTLKVAVRGSKSLIEETTYGKFKNLESPIKLQILQLALAVPDDLEKTGQSNPDLAIVQSNAKSEISSLLLELNNSADALDYAKQGAEALQAQVDQSLQNLDADQKLNLLDYLSVAYNRLFAIQRQTNNNEDALKSTKREFEVAQDGLNLAPASAHWQQNFATSYIDMGQTQRALGDLASAMTSFSTAKDLMDKLVEKNKDNAEIAGNRGVVYEQIGLLLSAQDKDAEALDYFRTSLTIASTLFDTDKSSTQKYSYAISLQNVGKTQMWLGQYQEALPNLTKFRELAEELKTDDPENSTKLNMWAVSNNVLGTLFKKMNNAEKAIGFFQEDLNVTEKLAQEDSNNYNLQANLARSYFTMADLGVDALANYNKALAILAVLAKDKPLPQTEVTLQSLIETAIVGLPQSNCTKSQSGLLCVATPTK